MKVTGQTRIGRRVRQRSLGGPLVAVALSLALALGASGCKIKKIVDQEAEAGSTAQNGFDPARYVTEVWEVKALPYFQSEAHPLTQVLAAIRTDIGQAGTKFGRRAAEGAAWNFVVKGSGTVTSKDTTSRAGKIAVSVDGASPAEEVTIQVGPVVRGNAIRDSLPFISFQEFTNQLEFADAGKALTARSINDITPSVAALQVGAHLIFTGAMSINSASDPIVITPVLLQPGEEGVAP